MKKLFFSIAFMGLLISCGSNQKALVNSTSNSRSTSNTVFKISEVSKDATYGYEQKNPVKVGGIRSSSGPQNERKYLNSLKGPKGEDLLYYRAGSCCAFKTKNGILGSGLLDVYRVYWEDSKDTLTIYINMYDKAKLKAPKGLTIKN